MIFQYLIPRRFRDRAKNHEPLMWLLMIGTLLFVTSVIFTALFYLCENVSLIEAIWQAWQTMTTIGYGNKPAETVSGRIAVIIMGTFSLALLSIFIGAAVDTVQYFREMKRSGQMSNKQSEGYVIFNFPGAHRAKSLIIELRAVEKDVPICVVDSQLAELPTCIATLPNIHFVSGNILSKSTYERANLKEAKAVIVFASDSDRPDSDGQTKTIVEQVCHFIDAGRCRIMHELVDPENSWLFEGLPSTEIMGSIEVMAFVQECQGKYTSDVIQELLKNSEGNDPVSVKAERFAGDAWGNLAMHILGYESESGDRASVLAMVRGGKVMTCPRADTIIEDGDTILLVAMKGFNWMDCQRAYKS